MPTHTLICKRTPELRLRTPAYNMLLLAASSLDICASYAVPAAQVDNMTNKHAVYMTRDGRISLAGLSSSKVNYLADAIVDSVRNH
jgi:hypothetical protein